MFRVRSRPTGPTRLGLGLGLVGVVNFSALGLGLVGLWLGLVEVNTYVL